MKSAKMTSQSQVKCSIAFDELDVVDLSPYVLPEVKKSAKRVDFGSKTSFNGKVSWDSGIGSCDFSEEGSLKEGESSTTDSPTSPRDLDISWVCSLLIQLYIFCFVSLVVCKYIFKIVYVYTLYILLINSLNI